MAEYIVADLVGPDLRVVDVVVLVGEVAADHCVHLLLHEGPDVIEHRLLLFTHTQLLQLTQRESSS
jgi:hypothetical protein